MAEFHRLCSADRGQSCAGTSSFLTARMGVGWERKDYVVKILKTSCNKLSIASTQPSTCKLAYM